MTHPQTLLEKTATSGGDKILPQTSPFLAQLDKYDRT